MTTRATQVAVPVLSGESATTAIRVTQLVVPVLTGEQAATKIRVTQLAVSVLRSLNNAAVASNTFHVSVMC